MTVIGELLRDRLRESSAEVLLDDLFGQIDDLVFAHADVRFDCPVTVRGSVTAVLRALRSERAQSCA